MKHRAISVGAAMACLLVTAVCPAQPFSEPPPGDEPLVAHSEYPSPDRPPIADGDLHPPLPSSTVRLHTGPALRISEHSPDGGLFAALDIGERAAGIRFSGAWIRVGAERGMSQYAGELWIDFGHDQRLHPILGAGAGAARIDLVDRSTGETEAHTVGVGILRGSLQYVLPVRGTDARASIDLVGSVPAIRGEDTPEAKPWLLALATVGVGF
jgi:hypothetical protein